MPDTIPPPLSVFAAAPPAVLFDEFLGPPFIVFGRRDIRARRRTLFRLRLLVSFGCHHPWSVGNPVLPTHSPVALMRDAAALIRSMDLIDA